MRRDITKLRMKVTAAVRMIARGTGSSGFRKRKTAGSISMCIRYIP